MTALALKLRQSDEVVLRTRTIAEVAHLTAVTPHTLRYYERIGLLGVARHTSGHRRYTEGDVNRVMFITRLRLTAMPIREIQRYFRLVAAGPSTEPDRLALLEHHRDRVRTQLGELRSALGAIDFKIAMYGGSASPDCVQVELSQTPASDLADVA
jgi:DNA-binding transcriptional MerR regulator